MRLLIRLLLVVAVTFSMIGCGASSTKEPTGTAEKAPTAGTSTAAAVELPDFIARMQAGLSVAFTAHYVLSGFNTAVDVQQQLPSYYVATTSEDGSSTETLVTDGTNQYVCQSETRTCSRPSFKESLADFAGYYTAIHWIAEMQQWPTYIPGQFDAVTITPSTMSFADQQADCIIYKNPTKSAKVCLFDSGVIAWLQSGSDDFYATEYSPTVTPGIFAVPAGYTVSGR